MLPPRSAPLLSGKEGSCTWPPFPAPAGRGAPAPGPRPRLSAGRRLPALWDICGAHSRVSLCPNNGQTLAQRWKRAPSPPAPGPDEPVLCRDPAGVPGVPPADGYPAFPAVPAFPPCGSDGCGEFLPACGAGRRFPYRLHSPVHGCCHRRCLVPEKEKSASVLRRAAGGRQRRASWAGFLPAYHDRTGRSVRCRRGRPAQPAPPG